MRVKVLYQRDYLQLLVKYGLEPPSQLADDAAGGSAPQRLDLGLDSEPGAGAETA